MKTTRFTKRDILRTFPLLCRTRQLEAKCRDFTSAKIRSLSKKEEELRVLLTEKIPEFVKIDIEWKKSRTFGMNPHASVWVRFSDGTSEYFTDGASGCGYDKQSAVVASALNRCARSWIFAKRRSRKKVPYGIYTDSCLYMGAVGMCCYESICDYLGVNLEKIESKTFDRYIFTKK